MIAATYVVLPSSQNLNQWLVGPTHDVLVYVAFAMYYQGVTLVSSGGVTPGATTKYENVWQL